MSLQTIPGELQLIILKYFISDTYYNHELLTPGINPIKKLNEMFRYASIIAPPGVAREIQKIIDERIKWHLRDYYGIMNKCTYLMKTQQSKYVYDFINSFISVFNPVPGNYHNPRDVFTVNKLIIINTPGDYKLIFGISNNICSIYISEYTNIEITATVGEDWNYIIKRCPIPGDNMHEFTTHLYDFFITYISTGVFIEKKYNGILRHTIGYSNAYF